MALLQTTSLETGIIVENAYKRVEMVQIADKSKMLFTVKSYAGSPLEFQAFDTKSYQCEYDIDGKNPIKQAYVYLKTLPEFESAQDC